MVFTKHANVTGTSSQQNECPGGIIVYKPNTNDDKLQRLSWFRHENHINNTLMSEQNGRYFQMIFSAMLYLDSNILSSHFVLDV